MKKLTIEFIREQFEKEGYILVSTEYIGANKKLDYICPKGHEGSIRWNDFNHGHKCAKCRAEKMSIIMTGKYPSEETKKKMSENHTDVSGKNNPNFGKHWSIETKQKMSEAKIGKYCGEKHPKWNPSLTNEERIVNRKYPEYVEWRNGVFEKANYTCEVCGDKTGGNLEAHHLNSYRANPDLRTTLSNGVCLCETCHKNFHHQYGYGDNTEEQFKLFIGE